MLLNKGNEVSFHWREIDRFILHQLSLLLAAWLLITLSKSSWLTAPGEHFPQRESASMRLCMLIVNQANRKIKSKVEAFLKENVMIIGSSQIKGWGELLILLFLKSFYGCLKIYLAQEISQVFFPGTGRYTIKFILDPWPTVEWAFHSK